jgi:hypothetical protein
MCNKISAAERIEVVPELRWLITSVRLAVIRPSPYVSLIAVGRKVVGAFLFWLREDSGRIRLQYYYGDNFENAEQEPYMELLGFIWPLCRLSWGCVARLSSFNY